MLHLLSLVPFFNVFSRALISRIMSSLAIFSIIVMIILNEVTFARVDNEDTKATWCLKLILTMSTVILLVLILYYHHLDMTAYTYRNRLDDWRVQLTSKKIFFIALELVICVIHPVPRSYPAIDPPRIQPISHPMSYMPFDIALSLPSTFACLFITRKSGFFSFLFSVSSAVFTRSFINDSFISSSKYSITFPWISQSCSDQCVFSHQNLLGKMASTMFTIIVYCCLSHL